MQPWNFPYYQLARFVAPALMAGNVVMVKHASSVPHCALAFAGLLEESGAPAGAYTNLFITKDQAARVIADPRVKGVALTGSDAAGATVAAQAGKALEKSTMELGGSDPLIVLEDALLDDAVWGAIWGRFHNAGQPCVASKRLIVVEALADRFLERFKAAASRLRMGNPLDESTTLAPLSSREALDRLVDQVGRAVAEGARRSGRAARRGNRRVHAAHHPHRHPARGKNVARRTESGMVFINRATWTAPELPFGGIKRSGYGRELSHLGIQEFVNKKVIRVTTVDAPY